MNADEDIYYARVNHPHDPIEPNDGKSNVYASGWGIIGVKRVKVKYVTSRDAKRNSDESKCSWMSCDCEGIKCTKQKMDSNSEMNIGFGRNK
jgi:hypothetical protein